MTEDVVGYRILEQAGEGGCSVVYRAYQERLDRQVALKVLSVSTVDEQAMRRFRRESKITGKLSGHPNIVTVLDIGTTRSGRPYISMEYFEQGSLSDRLAGEGLLPVADVLRIGVKIAGALAATHEIDVLHRDIKPQNILVSRYGEPALADFGIAQLVDPVETNQTVAFTPYHAAPEILEGKLPSVASDLYSLGSTLYQLLAGKPAFIGPRNDGIGALILRIMHDPPPPIPRGDLPPAVFDVILQAMAKDAAHRFPTAVAFARRLQGLQAQLGLPVTDLAYGGGTVPATPSPPAPPVPPAAPPPPPPPPTPPPLFSFAPSPPAPVEPVRQTAALGTGPSPGGRFTDLAAPLAETGDRNQGTTPQEVGARSGASVRGSDGPRRGFVGATIIAVAGGLVLGIAGLLMFGNAGRGGGQNHKTGGLATSPGIPTGTATGGADPVRLTTADIDAARPKSVTATAVAGGSSVRLRWRLSPGNTYPLFVKEEGPHQPVALPQGTKGTVIDGLVPGRHCFTVGAVLDINPPQYAKAKPACVG